MNKPKGGLGESPLNGMFSPTVAEAPKAEHGKQKRQGKQREHGKQRGQMKQAEPVEPAAPEARQRFTVHLPALLVEQLRRAVFYSPGVTLSGLAEQALRQALARLEKEHGGPFPDSRGSLRGRPIKL